MSRHREASACAPLELWGGVECTVNRVGDLFRDQLVVGGHALRERDLEQFAALGLKAIRYPLLWERTAPRDPGEADWSWGDARLTRIQALGMRPIVGLVHHGSGPAHTSLVDGQFPSLLAQYAAAVAERFPWVDAYTPVNEPLTTARFSGLYGFWYPHHTDDRSFVRALVHECRGTALAMQAIRRVNPAAQLVQTEDLGKSHSTPLLAYQARFENHRRWLTFDLLCGRVDRRHPLWRYLTKSGATETELNFFLEQPCPPDVIGCNYYLTSERYLDDDIERYPAHTIGGNGRHRYADVEAVRTLEHCAGLAGLLRETWERYRLPIAITEVHLGCHREGQLRWLLDAWQAAQRLRTEGIDLRAVTTWALLGSFDWNSLCTRSEGYYEPGAFDVSSGKPRPTALAAALTALGRGEEPQHPALPSLGWWQRPERLTYAPSASGRAEGCSAPANVQASAIAPLLIFGAAGRLGQAFVRACQQRGLAYVALTRQQLDITSAASIEAALEQHRPWVVVNAAGYASIDQAEREPDACLQANVAGVEQLARVCARHAVPLATFSSDLVFDGAKQEPYLECDPVRPLSTYGRSQAEAEQRVVDLHDRALVIRTSTLFCPWDEKNLLTKAMHKLARGQTVRAASNWIVSPTYTPDLVHATLDLLVDQEQGIWHLANDGATNWADVVHEAAQLAGIHPMTLVRCHGETLNLAAPRPRYSALASERGRLLPSLSHALARYAQVVRNQVVEPETSLSGVA